MDTFSENIDLHKFKPERANNTFSGEGDVDSTDDIPSIEGRWENKRDYQFKPKNELSVFDVAAYILEKQGHMTTMKLHKLVYYSQAWSLVWDEKPLFHERIEAWANGPVIRDLFAYHKGYYNIEDISLGNASKLTPEQKETIDAVLDYYGNKSSQWLIELSHMELPWKSARKGLSIEERGNREITHESMSEYYSSL